MKRFIWGMLFSFTVLTPTLAIALSHDGYHKSSIAVWCISGFLSATMYKHLKGEDL